MRVLVASFVMVALLIGGAQADPATISGTASVIDGDTIDVGVVRIRLHGIDAPEAGQPCTRADGGEWQCGKASTDRLAELIDGHRVECEALDRDQYGRVIGRCFHNGVDKNALLVEEGFAWSYRHFSDDYVELEERARAAGIGIWAGRGRSALGLSGQSLGTGGGSFTAAGLPDQGKHQPRRREILPYALVALA